MRSPLLLSRYLTKGQLDPEMKSSQSLSLWTFCTRFLSSSCFANSYNTLKQL